MTRERVAVRPAEPGDAAALVELGRAVGSEPGRWLITTDDWRSAADERRYLKALRRYEHAAVFVAETDGGAIVGRLSLARDQHPASSHVADLGLMVAASHRRQGVGRMLLQAAVELGARARRRRSSSCTSSRTTRPRSRSTSSSASSARATASGTTGAATATSTRS